jgi:integrase
MRGNINWQVHQIFDKSGINQIGQSKHKAKDAVKSNLGAQGIKPTWHVMGKRLGVYSYRTADLYRDIWKQIGPHVKEHFKIKDFEMLEGRHIRSFLEEKIKSEVAHSTFAQYAAACEKLESALNGFAEATQSGRSYEFTADIKAMRAVAHDSLARFEGTRAYDNPRALISAISDPAHQLVARIQFESGCRISECTFLSEKNLRGVQPDPVTGQEKGVIFVEKAKGGKSGEKFMDVDTYRMLVAQIKGAPAGRFEVNHDPYRNSLIKAAKKTDQKYTGSHGLRWNFARNRLSEVQRVAGLGDTESLCRVSVELFHERGNITLHYLK